jgi:hypothetical protein
MTGKEKYEALVGECSDGHDMLLSLEMAAKLVGISGWRLRRLVKAGKIPLADKFGDIRRVRLSAVLAAILPTATEVEVSHG